MKQEFCELVREAAAAAMAAQQGAAPLPMQRYLGVRGPRRGKYAAEISVGSSYNRRVWLGTYATAVEAAYAYDIAARVLRGDKSRVNFPEPRPVPAGVDDVAALVRAGVAEVKQARDVRRRQQQAAAAGLRAAALAQAASPCCQQSQAAAPARMPKPPVRPFQLREPAPHLFRFRPASGSTPAGEYLFVPDDLASTTAAANAGGSSDARAAAKDTDAADA